MAAGPRCGHGPTMRPRGLIFRIFATPRNEDFVAQYVIRECRRGRALDEVLDDPYVVNRTTSEVRGRLLDRPELVAEVGESTVAQLRASLAAERMAHVRVPS